MAFNKSVGEEYTIKEDGQILVLRLERIYEDGELVATKRAREVLEPGADVSAKSERLQRLATVEWTPEVIKSRGEAIAAARRVFPDRSQNDALDTPAEPRA